MTSDKRLKHKGISGVSCFPSQCHGASPHTGCMATRPGRSTLARFFTTTTCVFPASALLGSRGERLKYAMGDPSLTAVPKLAGSLSGIAQRAARLMLKIFGSAHCFRQPIFELPRRFAVFRPIWRSRSKRCALLTDTAAWLGPNQGQIPNAIRANGMRKASAPTPAWPNRRQCRYSALTDTEEYRSRS